MVFSFAVAPGAADIRGASIATMNMDRILLSDFQRPMISPCLGRNALEGPDADIRDTFSERRAFKLPGPFDSADIPTAKRLLQEIRKVGAPKFHLDTTISDLELSVDLTQNPNLKAGLSAVLAEMRRLV